MDSILKPAKSDTNLNLRLLGAMSVRYVGDVSPRSLQDLRPLAIGENISDLLSIFENPYFLPRARLAFQAIVEPDDERAALLLRDPGFPFQTTVVLSSGEPVSASGEPSGTAVIEVDRSELVRIRVQSTSPGLLVLSDTYFPGWQASVDGESHPILRANLAFRAVAVPAGDHEVEFRYEPASFRLGVALTVIGLLIVAWAYLPIFA
jgi:hypothetical protein